MTAEASAGHVTLTTLAAAVGGTDGGTDGRSEGLMGYVEKQASDATTGEESLPARVLGASV